MQLGLVTSIQLIVLLCCCLGATPIILVAGWSNLEKLMFAGAIVIVGLVLAHRCRPSTGGL